MKKKTIHIKRVVAAVLSGCLIAAFAGCGGTESETAATNRKEPQAEEQNTVNAMGRYMEEQKTTPENLSLMSDLVRLADGSLATTDERNGTYYISRDNGDSWENKEIPALAALDSAESEVGVMAVDPTGGVFFSYTDWREGMDHNMHYQYINADGNERDIPMENMGSTGLEKAVFAEDGSLYVLDWDAVVYKLDLEQATLQKLFDIGSSIYIDLYSCGDYVLGISNNSVIFYQISTGEQLEEDSTFNDFMAKQITDVTSDKIAFALDKEGKTVYSASKSGLYSHVLGGSTMEELLSGELSTLGDPSKKVVSLLADEDGSFTLAYTDGEIDYLTYDESVSTVPDQQITVYSLNDNDTLSKAVSSFRKQHPEVYVKHELGVNGENGVTDEDAIRNLNTKLLAGEGPDVILLDGMPIDSYIEKGMLADLSDLASEFQKEGNYFTNILTCYQREDGLYAMPIRFLLPITEGEAETLQKIHDLSSFANVVVEERSKNPERETILGTYTAEELLRALSLASAPAWMKDGELNRDTLKEFLSQAEKIYQAEHQNLTEAMVQQHQESQTRLANYGILVEPCHKLDHRQLGDILSGLQSIGAGYVDGMDSFKYVAALSKNKDSMSMQKMQGQSEDVFCPVGIVGINQDSKEKEIAEVFLEELFGETTQQTDLGDGLPVNADAYDGRFTSNPIEGYVESFSLSSADSSDDSDMVVFSVEWPTKEDFDFLKNLITELKTPSETGGMLEEAVIESGQKVLEGSLTVEEGVDEIAQKMEIYFSE